MDRRYLPVMNPCGHTGFESGICEVCGYPDPRKTIAEKNKRIKELQESHDAWEAGWRTMNTALLKAQEQIKELEETIYNIRYPHTTNPDEYVGDEIGGE